MKKIELTKNQTELILWACEAALDQHQKFLHHDGVTASCWADTRLLRAIKLLKTKLASHKATE